MEEEDFCTEMLKGGIIAQGFENDLKKAPASICFIARHLCTKIIIRKYFHFFILPRFSAITGWFPRLKILREEYV